VKFENFVVIDVETTGFGKTDRIVEISAITLDAETGRVVDEFDSLINPLRDISNSNIHGINASMVASAPTFEEIAISFGNIVQGNVIVAHNISFDVRMIAAEYQRLGVDFDSGIGQCTLKMTGAKLDEACRKYGIDLSGAHRSINDARATAELFNYFRDSDTHAFPVNISGLTGAWNPRTYRREHATSERSTSTIRQRRKLYFPSSVEIEVIYLDVLDHFFEDSRLSEVEILQLKELSLELGLEVSRVNQLHYDYLLSIHSAAIRDGIISEQELSLMTEIANSLNIENFELPAVTTEQSIREIALGTRICFTGEAHVGGGLYPRHLLETMAAIAGFQPVSAVTKKGCDILVSADPTSMSGKAKKAREFQIPILSVENFLALPEIASQSTNPNQPPDWFIAK
jgi:DNA polymerase-3 subunit epsilon